MEIGEQGGPAATAQLARQLCLLLRFTWPGAATGADQLDRARAANTAVCPAGARNRVAVSDCLAVLASVLPSAAKLASNGHRRQARPNNQRPRQTGLIQRNSDSTRAIPQSATTIPARHSVK